VSTSNISNDYDTVNPVGIGVSSSSVTTSTTNVSNNHLKTLNASSSKRVFLTSSSEQRKLKEVESDIYDSERLVDPSDFDDDLDMPSLTNGNDMEMRRNVKAYRGSNPQSQSVASGSNGLMKSTRSLPSTSISDSHRNGDNGEIDKIHVLDTSFPSSSKSLVNSKVATAGASRKLLGTGRNKRSLESSTMQNSPLHLDTIM